MRQSIRRAEKNSLNEDKRRSAATQGNVFHFAIERTDFEK
jgi:hypothetical protein